ncbi:MAG: ROK family protein [Anaerolineaceae bacterium]|nr:ROK family protein [Anaerolineaceae bacterium]
MQYVIGIDIGGTKIAGALVHRDGQFCSLQQVSTPAQEGPQAVLGATIQLIKSISAVAANEGHEVIGIGIGAAGQINIETGDVTYAVETLPRWTGTRIATPLHEQFGVPVVVDNDVNAMAIAELKYGTGRGFQNSLYVAVGTGVGGALILNGQLWRGTNWSAGELGHMMAVWNGDRVCNCGQAGHLEAYAAGPAMARRYAQLCGLEESTDLRPIVLAAKQGDTIAQDVIVEGARILGTVLSGLVNVFDPQALIIGGGVADLGEFWWMPFQNALRANPLPASKKVQIHLAQLGNNAVLIGAAWLAWEKLI